MLIWLPIPLLLITLLLLLRAEIRVPMDQRQVKIWKPLSTALVILVCALSLTRDCGQYDSAYTLLILAGLLFSLAGDVLLIYQSSHPRAFLGGLVAFLLAHVTYIAAFICSPRWNWASTWRAKSSPPSPWRCWVGPSTATLAPLAWAKCAGW